MEGQYAGIVEELEQLARYIENNLRISPILGPTVSSHSYDFPRELSKRFFAVREAQNWIANGRPGEVLECTREFLLTDQLDQFWELADRCTGNSKDPSPVRVVTAADPQLLTAISERVNGWSLAWLPTGFLEIRAGGEPVALARFTSEGVTVGSYAIRWLGPSTPNPIFGGRKPIGFLPSQLLSSKVGPMLLIDLTRRSIKSFHRQKVYCANCCAKCEKGALENGVCDACRCVVF